MWKLDSNTSLYTQIVDIITEKIVIGEYPINSKLPSVRQLAKEAGVNPNTMQKALSKLEDTGLVASNRTTGRYVCDDKNLVQKTKIRLSMKLTENYILDMQKLGFSYDEIIQTINKYSK